MRSRKVYLLAFVAYVVIVSGSYYFFGAEIATVAGIVSPALGFLANVLIQEPSEEEDDEEPTPKHEQEAFVETLEERKRHAKSRLEDHLTLRENTLGEIEVHINSDKIRGVDQEAMLYVFGQWAKADADPQESPIVTKHEIRENTSQKGRSVGVFLSKMAHFIKRHYPEDPLKREEMTEEEMEFQLDEDYLEEIVEYILGERNSPN